MSAWSRVAELLLFLFFPPLSFSIAEPWSGTLSDASNNGSSPSRLFSSSYFFSDHRHFSELPRCMLRALLRFRFFSPFCADGGGLRTLPGSAYCALRKTPPCVFSKPALPLHVGRDVTVQILLLFFFLLSSHLRRCEARPRPVIMPVPCDFCRKCFLLAHRVIPFFVNRLTPAQSRYTSKRSQSFRCATAEVFGAGRARAVLRSMIPRT